MHYDIRYRDVAFLPTKVLVDYTYIGRFRVNTPDGPRWERRLADNRMVLGQAERRLVSDHVGHVSASRSGFAECVGAQGLVTLASHGV